MHKAPQIVTVIRRSSTLLPRRSGLVVMLSLAAICTAVSGFLPLDSRAADIYRWTDESGKVHIADTVPEKYRSSATHYDAREFERTEEQIRRAAIKRSETAAALKPAPLLPQSKQAFTPAPGLATVAQGTPALDPETADCDALHREFKSAQECFARFRTLDGIRGQAFQMCRDLPAPPARCGLQKIYR